KSQTDAPYFAKLLRTTPEEIGDLPKYHFMARHGDKTVVLKNAEPTLDPPNMRLYPEALIPDAVRTEMRAKYCVRATGKTRPSGDIQEPPKTGPADDIDRRPAKNL